WESFSGFGGFDPFQGFPGFEGLSFWISQLFGSGSSSGATANIVTGLGSPIGPSLVENLVTSTTTTPLTLSSSGTNGTSSMPTIPSSSTRPIGSVSKHHHIVKHHHTTHQSKTHASSVAGRRVITHGLRKERLASSYTGLV